MRKYKKISLFLFSIILAIFLVSFGSQKVFGSSVTFTKLNQNPTGGFSGLAIDSSNHNVYATVSGGDIYEQIGGTGNFVALGQTSRNWSTNNGLAIDSSNHNVYAVAFNYNTGFYDIYEQTGGTGSFAPSGETSFNFSSIAVDSSNHNIYATMIGGGNIYKQIGGAGNFMPIGNTYVNFSGIAVDSSNHNVYAVASSSYYDIYEQTGGAGNFVALNQYTPSWWSGLAIDSSNHNVYATVSGGDIYEQIGGTGNFVALGQTPRWWQAIVADSSNHNIYATGDGDIYEMTPPMSGTLTSASSVCVIPVNASGCSMNFTWNTVNPIGISAVTSSVTDTGVSAPNTDVSNPNANSGSQNFAIPYNGRNFYLYNNAVLLAQATIPASSVTCASGSLWNGVICAASVNGAPGTASGKNYLNGTSGYGSDTQCSAGTSSNTNFPVAGGNVTWNCVGLNGGATNGPYSASQSAPATSVTISASLSTIFTGNSTSLTWSSNASSCSGTNFTVPGNEPSGSVPISPTSTVTYTITCGTAPNQATKQV
ncbi:MAG: hypothetical protein WAN61_02190, partial [Minisyncoccia bacterium]